MAREYYIFDTSRLVDSCADVCRRNNVRSRWFLARSGTFSLAQSKRNWEQVKKIKRSDSLEKINSLPKHREEAVVVVFPAILIKRKKTLSYT